MKRLLLVCFLLLSLRASAQDYLPLFVSGECPYFLRRHSEAEGVAIACGILAVAEDRAAGDSRKTLELFVARISARFPNGNAPLVILDGGPGSAASQLIKPLLATHLHLDYDIIVIDQRGTGLSRPSLNCPERDAGSLWNSLKWLQVCYRRLERAGIALSAYTSADNAHDIHDLLETLAIPEANIYSLSYGTRLAFTLLRDFPGRIRAVIMDAVVPPAADILNERAGAGNRAFEQLFQDCAADAACRRAYPNLRRSLYESVDRLNRKPAELPGDDPDQAIRLTGDDLIYELHAALYHYRRIPFLPAFIHAYAEGDYDYDPESAADDAAWRKQYRSGNMQPSETDLTAMDLLDIGNVYDLYDYYWELSVAEREALRAEIAYLLRYQPFQEYLGLDSPEAAERYLSGLEDAEYSQLAREVIGEYDSLSDGMNYSVQCAEEVHFNCEKAIRLGAAAVPDVLKAGLVALATDRFIECEHWRVPRASAIENQPVISDVPVLMLSGSYDPISPPEWAAAAASHLETSWRFVLPDIGHGSLLSHSCAETIMLSFLAYPQLEPRAECLEDLTPPDFYTR